jgi:hypothetical protein
MVLNRASCCPRFERLHAGRLEGPDLHRALASAHLELVHEDEVIDVPSISFATDGEPGVDLSSSSSRNTFVPYATRAIPVVASPTPRNNAARRRDLLRARFIGSHYVRGLSGCTSEKRALLAFCRQSRKAPEQNENAHREQNDT